MDFRSSVVFSHSTQHNRDHNKCRDNWSLKLRRTNEEAYPPIDKDQNEKDYNDSEEPQMLPKFCSKIIQETKSFILYCLELKTWPNLQSFIKTGLVLQQDKIQLFCCIITNHIKRVLYIWVKKIKNNIIYFVMICFITKWSSNTNYNFIYLN
jgi:hypothetical protein